ncbi:hypothetical protein Tco_1132476 [Tanacetum coccineum]|uniref:Kinetochore protein Nuf2 n=1 Tax=Tanacetum coccineum TaxID=301880 RepID=A0ABQ5JC17_9ASTR
MDRDTIQLNDIVSTIFREYLLEFTSKYGIPEDLHPELPGLEDTMVDFLEGKVGVYTKFFEFANYRIPLSQFLFDILGYYQIHLSQLSVIEMDLFNLISVSNPAKVKTGTRPRAAHEVPLLIATANRVIDMDTTEASGSSGTPSTVEKSPLDFADEDLPPPNTKGVGTKEQVWRKRWPPWGPREQKAEADASAKVLRKDHLYSPAHSAYGGKYLTTMGLGADSISPTPSAHGTPTAAKSVSDLDPLSYAKPQPYLKQDISQSSRGTAIEIPTEHVAITEVNVQLSVGIQSQGDRPSFPPWLDFLSQYNMNLARQVSMDSQLRLRFEQEVRLLKKARAKIARRDQRIQVREEEIKKLDQEVKSLRATETEVHGLRNQTKNLETLPEAEADIKKVAKAKNAELTKELESLRVRFSGLQFRKYEDDRVEQRCAEMDARLDKLSVDFDEELYLHMLIAIVGRRWVIGHDPRLAVMKCAESTELRQVFANVVSAGIAKGMSEGL